MDWQSRQQAFWAKTEGGGRGDPMVTHPVYLHLIDTGIVTAALLSALPGRVCAKIRALFPALGAEDASTAIALLAALHDIGKITPGFQTLRKESLRTIRDLGLEVPVGAIDRHDIATLKILRAVFGALGIGAERAAALAGAVAAHHGSHLTVPRASLIGGPAWDAARQEAMYAVSSTLARGAGTELLASSPDQTPPADALLLVSGLVSVADWIASNENWFAFQQSVPDMAEYLRSRSESARSIVESLHLGCGTLRAEETEFSALFDLPAGAQPNDVQRTATAFADDARGPSLYIIETPMGSGKTEAALSIYRTEAGRGARGLYCGLPTQASGNRMFDRVASFLSRAFAGHVEAHLLHSEAFMQDTYKEIRAGRNGPDPESGIVATEWFAGSKRGLLSTHGVGTADQAMLATLKRRHFFVRLFGLAGKVVVLDEVHAYDVYVSEVLRCLLSWLAAVDASVVLLSATLPAAKRRRLLHAYAPHAPSEVQPYPAVTIVSGQTSTSVQVSVDRKDVTLETVVVPSNLTVDWMVATAVDLTSDGGCAACLCNTVGRAQEVYRALTLLAPEADLVLLHSKYTRADRRVHEDRVAKAFGRTGVRPARAIVVATQVIEQSLDLDFDVMLTEIAPMDLLLQRVGRVHRHARPRHRRLTEARLMVAVPAEVHARCYEPSSFVYEPLILGRTQLALQEHGPAVVLPEDVSPLVERVYGDTPVQPPPELEDLMSKWEATSMGGHQAELYVARDSVIPSPADVSDEPSVLAMGGLGSDADAPVLTRLARPSIGVAVLDGPITGSTDASGIRKIWESVVRIDWDHWYQHFQNLPLSDSWRRTAVLRDLRPAVFADGSYRDGNRVLHYSSDLGLYRTRIEGGHDTSI